MATQTEEESSEIPSEDFAKLSEIRNAVWQQRKTPVASIADVGSGPVVLQPGERAVVPVKWAGDVQGDFECGTHPDASPGLAVLPGTIPGEKRDGVVVIENEGPFEEILQPRDAISVGVREDDIPTAETLQWVEGRREGFVRMTSWSGGARDAVKKHEGENGKPSVVTVIHHVPRFRACLRKEAEQACEGVNILARITDGVYQNGEPFHRVDGPDDLWTKERPWCGQTTFVQSRPEDTPSDDGEPDPEEDDQVVGRSEQLCGLCGRSQKCMLSCSCCP